MCANRGPCVATPRCKTNPPNNTRDRKCRVRNKTDCKNGQWLNGKFCQDKTTAESCANGEYLFRVPLTRKDKDNVCKAWTVCREPTPLQQTAPSKTQDRKCRKREPEDCGEDQWLQIIQPNRRVCRDKTTSCPKGFRLAESNNKKEDNLCELRRQLCQRPAQSASRSCTQ